MTYERIFFKNNGVTIINTRFVVEQKTYSMSSVSSVRINKTNVTSNTFPALLILIGAIWLFTHLMLSTADVGGYLLPILHLVGSILWYRSIKPMFEFKIVLTTTAGEQAVLVSNDENDVIPVERALVEAIIQRG